MPSVGQDNEDATGRDNSDSDSDNVVESNGLARTGAREVRKRHRSAEQRGGRQIVRGSEGR
jgi:hypothetical protein